jgi:hypothetical protein
VATSVKHDPPWTIVEEPTFAARFLLDVNDSAESVANVDVFVDLHDGSSWALTIFTVDEVRRLLSVRRDTGEAETEATFGSSTS